MSWQTLLRTSLWGQRAYQLPDYARLGPALARLDCNEAALPPDAEDQAAFLAEVGKLALNRYPHVSGRPLREALAARWHVDPEQILLGNGSEEIISILTIAFAGPRAGAPARVLYPDPTFNQYEALATAYGAAPVPVPLNDAFQLDESLFNDTIRRTRPALAFFASPNNPTGMRFDPAVLQRLARLMDAVFVVDEAYADFAGATLIPQVDDAGALFVMRSLSKVGLAGLRLGALVGPRAAIAELDKVRLPWNVNAVSLAFGCAALAHPERMARRIEAIVALREAFAARLRAIPRLTVYPSDANFLLVRVPVEAETVFNDLLARGVLVKNVSRRGTLRNCLRITVGTAPENQRCAEALSAALDLRYSRPTATGPRSSVSRAIPQRS